VILYGKEIIWKGEHFLHVGINREELEFNGWGVVVEKSKKCDAFTFRVEEFSHITKASNIYRHRHGNLIRFHRRLALYKSDHCLTVHENIQLYTHSVFFYYYYYYDFLGY
jgi:hypothetical protein